MSETTGKADEAPDATPLFFGRPERSRFGWLHTGETSGSVGLVVCSPFGYEAVCAHRSLRHFAEAAAALGLPALRFDYDGTGDSAGDDLDGGRVDAWLESIGDAIDALRAHAGVDRVCLLGVRLGALLATLAAEERDDVAGLIAVAPVISGRRYLRELKILQQALGLEPTAASAPAVPVDLEEAVGFAITAETHAALKAVDLNRRERPPAPRVLVLDRSDLPGAGKWPARLEQQGVAVQTQVLDGYVEMVLDPHNARVPSQMIAATRAWLGEQRWSDPPAATGNPGAPAASPRQEMTTGQVIERPVVVTERPALFGVLSTPASGAPSGDAILMLNAGSIHHVGPNRLYPPLARRWAALGHTVLRFDQSGLGDSPPHPNHDENVVYSELAVADVAAALDYLERRGAARVHVLGLCSGAYHAFKVAVAGHRLDSLIAINPLTFFYKPGMPLDFQPHQVLRATRRYQSSMWSLDSWRRLVRGETGRREVARNLYGRAAVWVRGHAQDVARRVGRPYPDDLAHELSVIARHDVDMHFVFASADPGLQILEAQGGSVVSRLRKQRKLSVHTIDGPDHTFTALWAQRALVDVLGTLLDRPG